MDVEVPPVADAVPPVAVTTTVMLFPDPATVSNRVDCRFKSRNGPQQLKAETIISPKKKIIICFAEVMLKVLYIVLEPH